MDLLPTATIVARHAMQGTALSALPNAPVVPYPERVPTVRARRVRAALSGALQRAAQAVAPPAQAVAPPAETCSAA